MKGTFFALGLLCVSATLTSCFKDEPLNAECDIEQAFIHVDNPEAMFFNNNDTLVKVLSSERNIKFKVLPEADITAVVPQFRVTPGATVAAVDGLPLNTPRDFSDGKTVQYTVTSEDGQWNRTYTVSMGMRTLDAISNFGFENVQMVTEGCNRPYDAWVESFDDGYIIDCWATGNGGFDISMGVEDDENHVTKDQFPSVSVDNGRTGKAVRLTTCDTGPFGHLMNMPIAAGNLFLGKFDLSEALGETLKATMFGVPVSKKPLNFSGYYKYKPGETFTNRDNKIDPTITDRGDIYAVLYRNTNEKGQAVTLDGGNVRTSNLIVATAIIDEVKTTDEWTFFNIPFTYTANIDPTTLARHGYSLAVVFTSSFKGADFQGAVGSTLYIDDVNLSWEE